jgi:hypothetical protein
MDEGIRVMQFKGCLNKGQYKASSNSHCWLYGGLLELHRGRFLTVPHRSVQQDPGGTRFFHEASGIHLHFQLLFTGHCDDFFTGYGVFRQ